MLQSFTKVIKETFQFKFTSRTILVSFFLILVAISIFSWLAFPPKEEYEPSKIVFHVIFFVLLLISYTFIAKTGLKTLQIGWGLYAFHEYYEVLEETLIIPEPIILTVFPGMIGLGIISIGFYLVHKHLKDKLIQSEKQRNTLQSKALSYKAQANHDALTGLLNRAGLLKGLQLTCLDSANAEKEIAVIFIDLNKFKPINDKYGHNVGDELLKKVAQRFKRSVREHDFVGRWGGDEFVIVINALSEGQKINVFTERLTKAFSVPIKINNIKHFVGASMGLALFPMHSTKAEELIDLADKAMYKAKQKGGLVEIVMSDLGPTITQPSHPKVSIEAMG